MPWYVTAYLLSHIRVNGMGTKGGTARKHSSFC